MTPGGVAVFVSVLGHPAGPARSRSFARICAIGESARDRGTGRRKTTAAVALGIKITSCPVCWGWAEIAIVHRKSRDRETVDDFVDANTVDRMHRRTRSPRGRTGHAFEACYFIPDNDGYPVSDPERPYALGLVGL